jgi:hypothetical protein
MNTLNEIVEGKISRLFELVPPRNAERARELYRDLVRDKGERALDDRIAAFEKVRANVEEWRAARFGLGDTQEIEYPPLATREDQETFVMKSAGVLDRDLEHCRVNAAKYSDTDLDEKIARIKAGAERIRLWRLTRGPAIQ